MKKSKKVVSSLLAMSMLVGILPATGAFAASDNRVSNVPMVADDYKGELGYLTIAEDKDYTDDFLAGKTFTVTLPAGVKIKNSVNDMVYYKDGVNASYALLPNANVVISGDYTVDITLPATVSSTTHDFIQIRPRVEIDGFDGTAIEATVDGLGSGITSGKFIIGEVAGGDTTATVIKKETVGDGNVKGGVIRITENSVGAIGDDPQVIKLKLPKDFKWNVTDTVNSVAFLGGFEGAASIVADKSNPEDRTLEIKIDPKDSRTQRGIIQITPYFSAKNDADFGDVTVELSGDKVDDADLIVAEYADYGATVKCDGDPEEIFAGETEQELQTLYIKEDVKGSIIADRKINIKFPSWVKISKASLVSGSNKNLTSYTIDTPTGEDNDLDITLKPNGNGKVEIKIDFEVSVQADKSGDVEAVVTSKAGIEGKVVLAKAIAPVALEATVTNVKIGAKGQAIGDIIITEGKDEGIKKGDLKLVLPNNVDWDGTPNVQVIEGNIDIDEDGVDTDDETLTIPVKSTSGKASKIKISGIKLSVDRTVPEGSVEVKVKGDAVVLNDKNQGVSGKLEAEEFDTDYVVKAMIANVATPAPEAGTAIFNVGSSIYTAAGVTKVMDAAPYIKDGRTYVPVRYLALAMGVMEDDIGFENGVVTLKKNDVTLSLTIGSKTLVKNDTNVQMDVAPEVVNGRTMLPARFVAEGFGGLVGFANGQVVISQ